MAPHTLRRIAEPGNGEEPWVDSHATTRRHVGRRNIGKISRGFLAALAYVAFLT